MKKIIFIVCTLLLIILLYFFFNQKTGETLVFESNPKIRLKTTSGDITLELFHEKAPKTVENFVIYVNDKHYDGTIFHRVIDGFMIQGGGFTPEMDQKSTRRPIENEARSDVKNTRGTIAMARTQDIHSATSQFFINLEDNDFLDHKSKDPMGYGYCVFGKVIDGMDVVDKIKSVQTTSKAGHRDVPSEPIVITEAVVVK